MTKILGDESPSTEFSQWAPGYPAGDTSDLCVYFSTGQDYHLSGFWKDTSCSTAGYYAVCEQYLLPE